MDAFIDPKNTTDVKKNIPARMVDTHFQASAEMLVRSSDQHVGELSEKWGNAATHSEAGSKNQSFEDMDSFGPCVFDSSTIQIVG